MITPRPFHIILLISALFFSKLAFSSQNSLTFNRPADTPHARYALELLKLAYAEIGYTIHIIDFNRPNALLAADNGVLDGQLGRDLSIEKDYKNLLRVNYPLFEFNLLLIKHCQPSLLYQLDSIAILNDYPVQADYLESVNFDGNIIRVKNIITQLNLLSQNAAQGMIVVDFVLGGEKTHLPNGCYQKQVLGKHSVYHYLHKNNKNLVAKLQKAFVKLHNNGTVYALRAKHHIAY